VQHVGAHQRRDAQCDLGAAVLDDEPRQKHARALPKINAEIMESQQYIGGTSQTEIFSFLCIFERN
jgi:hypothetical protein